MPCTDINGRQFEFRFFKSRSVYYGVIILEIRLVSSRFKLELTLWAEQCQALLKFIIADVRYFMSMLVTLIDWSLINLNY